MLFVGNEADCYSVDDGWAVVHACKTPCHQRAVGYRGNLPSTNPSYLVHEDGEDLYLNMIDPNQRGYLKPRFMLPMIQAAFSFIDAQLTKGTKVLIHCNQGISRSPSLAMLYMTKRLHCIDDSDFDSARGALVRVYPTYAPGLSIGSFLEEHWDDIE